MQSVLTEKSTIQNNPQNAQAKGGSGDLVQFGYFVERNDETHDIPLNILCNYVHQLQPGTDEEDYVLHISIGKFPTLEGEHLFHLMFLKK